MLSRISTGWELAKQSLAVLRSDRELLLLPVLSSISLIIVSASFLGPLVSSDYITQALQSDVSNQDPMIYVILFLFYFINYFVIMFFNAGLIGCAIIRFDGGDPNLGDAFRTSMECLPQIVIWALVSATVGVILKVIESRSEKVGQFVSAFLGMAWNVMTYFVLPVLVVEKAGPFEAISRSTSILKKTWGEALFANIGMGFIIFCFYVLAILPACFGLFLGTTVSSIIGVITTVLLMILIALVSSAVGTIITVALYEYAENRPPANFDQHPAGRDLLRGRRRYIQ